MHCRQPKRAARASVCPAPRAQGPQAWHWWLPASAWSTASPRPLQARPRQLPPGSPGLSSWLWQGPESPAPEPTHLHLVAGLASDHTRAPANQHHTHPGTSQSAPHTTHQAVGPAGTSSQVQRVLLPRVTPCPKLVCCCHSHSSRPGSWRISLRVHLPH